jgi:hypothetical protein
VLSHFLIHQLRIHGLRQQDSTQSVTSLLVAVVEVEALGITRAPVEVAAVNTDTELFL